MNKFKDEVFGEIFHDIDFIKKYEIYIFNKNIKVHFCINVDEFSEISSHHRQTFIEFEKNKKEIIRKIENTAIEYCKTNYAALNENEILASLELVTIIIYRKCTKNERIIGFVIDDEYDLEMGIGIEMINEEIHAVGTQHLVC